MKFDHVYEQLRNYRTPDGQQVLFLLAPTTMRTIYDCVLKTGAQQCLELGTGYGSTSCVIAAALDELGAGTVTTLDMMVHEPVGVSVLAAHTGLSQYINPILDPAGYNWYLADLIASQTQDGACAPCLDFCFLDGAHEWAPDALAVFLIAKLLRPDGWLVMDDLDFRLRGCMPGWAEEFASRTEKELDTLQLDRVFNLVLRQHPDFTRFTVSDNGRTGWARKRGDTTGPWAPIGQVLDSWVPEWHDAWPPADLLAQSYRSDGIDTMMRSGTLQLRTSTTDPFFILPNSLAGEQPVEVITLRVRLMKPAQEILQVFWTNDPNETFQETSSVRIKLAASSAWQDIAIRVSSPDAKRPVHAIRIDPSDGPSTILWANFAIGGDGARPCC